MTDLSAAAELVNLAHRQLREARRVLYRTLRERYAQPGRVPGEHGTPGGYMRHVRAGDVPCDACRDANHWAHQHPRRTA